VLTAPRVAGLVFYRHVSGRVVWKRPTADGDAEQAEDGARTAIMSAPPHTPAGAPPHESSSAVSPDGPLSEQLLSAGWKRYESHSTRRVFYRNRNTGQTQWTHPGLASPCSHDAPTTASHLPFDETQSPSWPQQEAVTGIRQQQRQREQSMQQWQPLIAHSARLPRARGHLQQVHVERDKSLEHRERCRQMAQRLTQGLATRSPQVLGAAAHAHDMCMRSHIACKSGSAPW